MFRYKYGKTTLIIAAMIIFLCLASITGATYALFTATTEDGKIGVNATSGKMEIDIVDGSIDNPESILGGALNFVTTSQNVEFEPGALYYTEGFRVQNNGAIPIKFIVYISADKDVPADFFDAFDVWITQNPNSTSEKDKLRDFEGFLGVGDCSGVYHLVFQMKTTAGNDFQGKTYSGVGITVCAVQGNGTFG